MKKILLITIGLSALLFADFTKSGDIVTDTNTGLQWQDDVIAWSSWNQAINYCENLTLGGYSDWRLPNINELKSIVDRSTFEPAIADVFSLHESASYWSSTTDASTTSKAQIVNFVEGEVRSEYKNGNTNLIRCVRAGG